MEGGGERQRHREEHNQHPAPNKLPDLENRLVIAKGGGWGGQYRYME